MKKHYENDPQTFPDDARYAARQYPGIAFYVLGWETEPDEDTHWSGTEERTGRVLAVMVGDDFRHSLDRDDLTAIKRGEYCGGCGQIGCAHDGLDRDEEDA